MKLVLTRITPMQSIFIGIILQEHTLRHILKVYRNKHCIQVNNTGYGNLYTFNNHVFLMLIIIIIINFIDLQRLWRRLGVAKSAAADTAKVEIFRGHVVVLRFLRW